jgi:hypothetical protein
MPYIAWKTPLAMKIFRVAKFKQRAQIKQNPYLVGMPSVSSGACAGATLSWLKRHIQQPAESATDRCAFLARNDTWDQIANFHTRFNTSGARSYNERIVQNLPNLCGRGHSSSTTSEGYRGLSDLVQHINTTGPGYSVWHFTFESVGAPHLCGIYDNGSMMTFFDPNSGEYRVPSIGKHAFFALLYKHYANYLSGDGKKKSLYLHKHDLVKLAN